MKLNENQALNAQSRSSTTFVYIRNYANVIKEKKILNRKRGNRTH